MTEISGTGILVPAVREGEPPTLAPLDGPKVEYDFSQGLEPVVDQLFSQYLDEISTGTREMLDIVTDIANLFESISQDPALIYEKLGELGFFE